MMKDKHITITL